MPDKPTAWIQYCSPDSAAENHRRHCHCCVFAFLRRFAARARKIHKRLHPDFPFKGSWWGADAAYSIPLPDGRSVWIFGDTLYGDRRVVEGSDPRMVRNSLGISTCSDRGWPTIIGGFVTV